LLTVQCPCMIDCQQYCQSDRPLLQSVNCGLCVKRYASFVLLLPLLE